MLEGTKQFRGKKAATNTGASENSPQQNSSASDSAPTNLQDPPAERQSKESNAANLDRRQWFGSLVPAFGDGLVKLLRGSNNLQRDLHEALKGKAGDLLSPPPDSSEK